MVPIGKNETKEQYFKRLERDHRLKEDLFEDEIEEPSPKPIEWIKRKMKCLKKRKFHK
jgi:hypothetical protein